MIQKLEQIQTQIRKLSRVMLYVVFFVVAAILYGLFAYVVVSLLPVVLSFFTSGFSGYVETELDAIVAVGGGAVFLGVLAAMVGYQLLKRFFLLILKLCHKACVYFSLEEGPVDKNGKPIEVKHASKKTRIMLLVLCLLVLVLLVWRALFSQTVSSSTDSDTTDISAASEAMMTYEGPYPTIEEMGLTSDMDAVDLSEWTKTDSSTALDAVEPILTDLDNADEFSQHTYFGMNIAGDMDAVGNTLVEYTLLDTDEAVLAAVIGADADGNSVNGVSYDMEFSLTADDEGKPVWMQSNSLAGLAGAAYVDRVNMIYSDGILYVNNAPKEPGGELVYSYTAQSNTDMEEHRANIGSSLMQLMMVNHSVSSLDAYVRTTDYGTDYYFVGSSEIDRGSYVGTLTKTVLLEQMSDGTYEATIVYSLSGDEPGGEMVFRVDTDTSDVTVDVPATEDVRWTES